KLTRTLGYKSSVYDKDTNLYSTYDAENGRFIVPSAVLDPFSSQSLNPYSFRKNNPFRDVTSEAVTPDLTIPERQDGIEGSSVSSDQTLSQKWEKQIYVPKIPYSLIKSAIQTVYMIGDILLTQLEPNVQKIPEMEPLQKMNYEGPDRVPYGPIDANINVPTVETLTEGTLPPKETYKTYSAPDYSTRVKAVSTGIGVEGGEVGRGYESYHAPMSAIKFDPSFSRPISYTYTMDVFGIMHKIPNFRK
ncbi:MAG: hypothetical protein AABX29_08455, partial [Nanoarchaeota archaeon]